MQTLRRRLVLALVSEDTCREAVVGCAQMIVASGNARLHVAESTTCLCRTSVGAPFHPTDRPHDLGESSLDAARRFAMNEHPAMLVAGWPTAPDFQDILRFASTLNVPGVFVRKSPTVDVDRVLIPISGGPNALKQLWVAKEIACRYGVPAHVLHVIQDGSPALRGFTGSTSQVALAEAQARALGIPGPVEVCVAKDVVSGVAFTARPNDLIAMGAPNYWRMATHFAGSIPDLIAQRVPNSLLMLLGRKPSRVRLRDIFWPRMISLNLKPHSKEDAIATLVQTLVVHNQFPHTWRDLLLDRALARERLMSTGVGSETAFPHITIPHFIGVAGCMGILPHGVDFGGRRGRNTRFVFVLLTPKDFYDEYLAVLSQITERMVLPALRRELLACRTPADVLDVLDPDEC